MRRLIDADALIEKNAYASDMWDRGTQSFDLPIVEVRDIEDAPTIQTKEVKYYDEDENVWKIGSVIVE